MFELLLGLIGGFTLGLMVGIYMSVKFDKSVAAAAQCASPTDRRS